VDRVAVVLGRQLAPGQDLDRAGGGAGAVQPGGGVVVGERDAGEPALGREQGDPLGGQGAVRAVGVGVQVEAGHERRRYQRRTVTELLVRDVGVPVPDAVTLVQFTRWLTDMVV
jgi:hypothetical protein